MLNSIKSANSVSRHMHCYKMAMNHQLIIPRRIANPRYFLWSEPAVELIKFSQEVLKKMKPSDSKEICLLTDHFRYHKSVPRVSLIQSIFNTIREMKYKTTKVAYIVGLPGTGKKELARQYGEVHYKNLSKGVLERLLVGTIDELCTANKFVAAINASNPSSFHQDLFKIAEQLNVTESYEQYCAKTKRPEGYIDILSKMSSHLKNHHDWLLIMNDLNLDDDLKWKVGERCTNRDYIQNTLKHVHLNEFLPTPGQPNHGTILITTCDHRAYRHCSGHVKSIHMPKGMEEKEAVQLLEISSCLPKLKYCEPALNVISDLQKVPTSVYCAGRHIYNKTGFGKSIEAYELFDKLYKRIQSEDFSKITQNDNQKRIDEQQYPLNMTNMQKLAVEDVAKSDPWRCKVFTLLACCAPCPIPYQFISRVVGKVPAEEDFMDRTVYGSEASKIVNQGLGANVRAIIKSMFYGRSISSELSTHCEVVQVASGYYDIFKELFLPCEGKEIIKTAEFEENVKSLTALYLENSRKDDIDTITIRRLLLPHLDSFLWLIENSSDKHKTSFEPYIADLNCCIGNAYTLEGELLKPSEYFTKALEIVSSHNNFLKQVQVYIQRGKTYRNASDKVHEAMSDLQKAESLLDTCQDQSIYEFLFYRHKVLFYKGDTYKTMEKFGDSQNCFLQCLEVLNEMQSTEEVEYFKLVTYLKLCTIQRKMGDDQRCKEYIKKVKEMLSNLYEDKIYAILEAELKLQEAIILRNLCLPEESTVLLQEVHSVTEQIYGKNHVKVALIESELSNSLRQNGDLQGSKKVAKSALKKFQKGELYHSERAKTLCNLGTTYTHLCEYENAEKSLKEGLELIGGHYDNSSETWGIRKTEILEKLGNMNRRKGYLGESLEFLTECVDLKKKCFSAYTAYHPELAQVLLSLGRTQHRMSLLAQSFESLHKALTINERYFGEEYPQTVFVKACIAKVHRDAGSGDESLSKINEALHLYEHPMRRSKFRKHLERHPRYVSMCTTKGVVHMDAFQNNPNMMQHGQEAKAAFQKALHLLKQHKSPSFLQEVGVRCHLGRVYQLMNDETNATKMFQDADKIIRPFGKYPVYAAVLANWSRVFYEKGDVHKAIDMLEEAWNIRDSFVRSELHPNTSLYAYYLAKYYEEIGGEETAIHWYNIAIWGYANLISTEEIRMKNLKSPHVVLQNDELPACKSWRQLLEECRNNYKKLV